MAIHDEQQQYWAEMVELKAASLYIRFYRDYLGSRVTTLATIRAIASSVSIAGWAVWQHYSFVWAAIIAVSQIADALKDVFPFAKKHKSAAHLALTLEHLFIDAQLAWDNISSGGYTKEEISTRLHKLRTLQIEAEEHDFPDGLVVRSPLRTHAEQDTKSFFSKTYGVKV